MKRGSWFLIGVSLLIGISTCMTADTTIHGLNKLALFLLLCVFVLHQRYRDGQWNIGKYMTAIVLFLCRALGFLGCPSDTESGSSNPSTTGNTKMWYGFLQESARLCRL